MREPLLLPGAVVHVDRLATGRSRSRQLQATTSVVTIKRGLGHHLPAGYCDLLLEPSGAYASDESSDAGSRRCGRGSSRRTGRGRLIGRF